MPAPQPLAAIAADNCWSLFNLNSETILRLQKVTVTGGMTFMIYKRSGRDRHFDTRTAVIQNGRYFLKVTVTR